MAQEAGYEIKFKPNSTVYLQIDGEALKVVGIKSVKISLGYQIKLLRAKRARAVSCPPGLAPEPPLQGRATEEVQEEPELQTPGEGMNTTPDNEPEEAKTAKDTSGDEKVPSTAEDNSEHEVFHDTITNGADDEESSQETNKEEGEKETSEKVKDRDEVRNELPRETAIKSS